ncbi:MAG: methionyl-tRNA formyltransferase [Acidimicrobiia bacterium]|nr:methionyl-tRNA formyltransferase [Acidimicrobiia bacterium]
MEGRAAFFGTPAAAVPALAALSSAMSIELVVTRPDRPRGRSGKPQPPPVKEAAEAWGLRVVQPGRAVEAAGQLEGLDLAVVVAYGQILPEVMLGIPTHGFINVHFSRLPRWRGAAPVARAILAGDTETGVDIMQLDVGMDTGPIIARSVTKIGPAETTGTLTARLAGIGADLLTDTIPTILDGSAIRSAQAEEGATVAAKLSAEEGRLDPRTMSAAACHRVVRAFNPNPGAWGMLDGERLKVWEVRVSTDSELPAGELNLGGQLPVVGTTEGGLELVEVQAAGRSRMPAAVWGRGYRGALRWV